MQIIKCLLTLLLTLGLTAFCHASINETSIAYNWARSGLNIRESPERTAKVIGAIPLGGAVEVLEVTTKDISIELSGIFSQEFSEDGSSYYIDGYWVKVKYENFVGYAFDGYLSEWPPMRITKINEANSLHEGFEAYLRRISTPVDSNIFMPENTEFWHHEIRFDNGGMYESNTKVGWYEHIFILPGADLKTGFLFFQLTYDTEQMRALTEREKIRIMKQSPLMLLFWTGGPEGEYEIYQFGSTLVIRNSNS